ncbi:MAG TPA: 2OG-Fe(II) oxygenase [Methylomirabilota bacterium]|nr:2OG-Fe(II) oxygenase [Methylomirabilota bacterium]
MGRDGRAPWVGATARADVRRLETLMVHSVEGFLSGAETRRLLALMDGAVPDPTVFAAPRRTTSIHAIRGMTRRAAAGVYEPRGRIEVVGLPGPATALLDAALERHAAAVRRSFPSLHRCEGWVYVEYGVGQHIRPHVDFARDDTDPRRRKVAGVTLLLHPADAGGEFTVYTCGADALWERGRRGLSIPQRLGPESPEFRALATTPWTVRQRPGTAVFYGAHVIHGTARVRRGRARKIIGFLGA